MTSPPPGPSSDRGSPAPFDWRTADPATVDHEYSPSRFSLRPIEEYLAEYRSRSAADRAPSGAGRPLLIYVHGGYWQMLSAAESLFNAADAAAAGVNLHATEYTLAPAATIEEMIAQCARDVLEVTGRLAPTRTVLAGSSAGAHLAVMCAADPRLAGRVDGLVLLSGVYDLRPLVVTPTNDALGLDEERATRLSPLLGAVPAGLPEVLCATGGHEPPEFIRQSAEFAAHLSAAGVRVRHETVAHRDHFDLPFDLLARGTTVGDWTLDVLGRGPKGVER